MFFIVVMLFGVFFVMGYIVGQNSAPPAHATWLPWRASPETKPVVVIRRAARRMIRLRPLSLRARSAFYRPAYSRWSSRRHQWKRRPRKPQSPRSPSRLKPTPPVRATSTRPTATKPICNSRLRARIKRTPWSMCCGRTASRRWITKRRKSRESSRPGRADWIGETNKVRADLQGKGFQGRDAIPKKF